MQIIDYDSKYDEEIKDLLVELQKYIASIDAEKYNILTDKYREENFKDTMKYLQENKGKIFLAMIDSKVVGLIMGTIIEEENTYDFKAPKGGRIDELIVTEKIRANGIGQSLLNKMENYFKSIGCQRVLIEVFSYNKSATDFYNKNGYFYRTSDIMKKI